MNTTISVPEASPLRWITGAGSAKLKSILSLATLIAFCVSVRGQSIMASGQITGTPIGGGVYTYEITLNNIGTMPIQTFWYSWIPGADFLPTTPASVQPPMNWDYMVMGGPYYDPYYGYYYPDGYSIEFTTSTMPLGPGSSLNFQFTSTDTPADLAGNSPIFTYYPVGTSYVFSGIGETGSAFQFLVESVAVPEPSPASLLALCCAGWLGIRRLTRRPQAERGCISTLFLR